MVDEGLINNDDLDLFKIINEARGFDHSAEEYRNITSFIGNQLCLY